MIIEDKSFYIKTGLIMFIFFMLAGVYLGRDITVKLLFLTFLVASLFMLRDYLKNSEWRNKQNGGRIN